MCGSHGCVCKYIGGLYLFRQSSTMVHRRCVHARASIEADLLYLMVKGSSFSSSSNPQSMGDWG